MILNCDGETSRKSAALNTEETGRVSRGYVVRLECGCN
jgi:hypothetical protein